MFRVVIVSLLLCVLFSIELLGSTPIVIEELRRKIYISEMDQFIDSTSSLTYDDFRNHRTSFFESAKDIQGVRNKKFTYWMTFEVEGDLLTREVFYLLCTDSRISEMQIWIDGELQTEEPIGTNYLFENRNLNHRYLVQRLPQKNKLEFVVKIRSFHSTFFAFEIKAENQFFNDSYLETGIYGAAYGVIILGLFFSLFMRMRFKDTIYLAYVVFAIVAILTGLFLDGGGFQFFWRDAPKINLYLLILLPFAVLFSSAGVVIAFLDAVSSNNRYFKIISRSLLISLLGYVFVFTIPEFFIHSIFYMIPFAAMIYCCVDKYRAGYKSTLPFIIGLVFVIAANLLFMMQPFVSVEYFHYLIRFAPHAGVVALTLALAYSQYKKFFAISESRKLERRRSIEHLQNLNLVKDQINEEIAKKVSLQTMELERKNAIIHRQNTDLQRTNEKLKVQSDEILHLNLLLNQENQELKSNVERITESRILENTVPFEEFKNYFNSDDECYSMLEDMKWKHGFVCTKCGNSKYGMGKGERARRCTKCGTNESVTSNTIFHRLHFSILKGFYILFLVNKHGDNLISKDLSEIVDLRLATCWKFSKKIKTKKRAMEKAGKVIESWLDLI